jgi:sugar lactone lactonase YvrE
VFEFYDAMPTGVTVAHDGRIFVNFPRWGDDVPFTVGEIRDAHLVPYPSAEINTLDPVCPGDTFISVQSVVVDAKNRLWILDTAEPSFNTPVPGGAKLVAIDLATNWVVQTLILPPSVVLPTTYINDVRFDLRQGRAGVAYITDSSVSGPGALIVVDLATGEAWRRLNGHPSTSPDPSFVPVVEGEAMAIREASKSPVPLRVASDGIAVSAYGSTVYFCPSSETIRAFPHEDRCGSRSTQMNTEPWRFLLLRRLQIRPLPTSGPFLRKAHGFPQQILRLRDLLSRRESQLLSAGDAMRRDVQLTTFIPAGEDPEFAGRANVRAADEHSIEPHLAPALTHGGQSPSPSSSPYVCQTGDIR